MPEGTDKGRGLRRLALILAILYVAVRVPLHFAAVGGLIPMGEEDWQGQDLAINLDAGRRVWARQDLYVTGPMPMLEVYHYSPLYAMACGALSDLPFSVAAALHSLITCAAYVALYLIWRRIFARWGWDRARQTLERLLPLWLIYGAFYGDLTFLNIYTVLCVLTSLLIYAVLEERLALALVMAALILQAKPHWAFPLLLPLLMRRYGFFLRLALGSIAIYVAGALAASATLGWAYTWQQYRDYADFLLNMAAHFPWRTPDMSLGYNHSLLQIGYHLFGVARWVRVWVVALKIGLLAPIAVVAWRWRRRPEPPTRRMGLEMAFALYLGAFLWLDVLWEVTLAIVVYGYLVSVWRGWRRSWPVRALFLIYAWQDVWLVLTYALVGEAMTEGYFWLDPATHVPLVMMALLACYGAVLWRLWRHGSHPPHEPAAQPV